MDSVLEKLSMHPSFHLSFQLQVGWVSQPLLSTRDLPTYLHAVKRDESYIVLSSVGCVAVLVLPSLDRPPCAFEDAAPSTPTMLHHQSPNVLWRDRFPHLIEVAKNCSHH